MKKAFFFVLALLLCNIAYAQMKVTGTVTSSDDGSSIPYATILVKGTQIRAISDLDGKYSINVPDNNATLVISYIGFSTQEIPVTGRSLIDIVLISNTTALDEVMVIAYGTATKGTYTGAASVVKSEEIKDIPGVSFETALNGRVAGLQITTNSGEVGSVSSIRIRGIGSMNASNEPLYVIDGVPVVSGSVSQLSDYIYNSTNVMGSLNPSDIASITVLKDAAASALYGSRAANGVIMVTTKRGKLGRPVINFKAQVGLTPSFATCNFDIASPEQQAELHYEMFWNASKYEGSSDAEASAYALKQMNKRFNKHGYSFTANDNTVKSLTIGGERAGKFFDWDKELFRTAMYHTYDLSVSGATETTNYYTSLSYTKQQGRSVTNDFNRFSGRVNLTQKIGRFVEFTTNVNVARSVQEGFNDTRSTGSNYFMQSRNLLWPFYWPTDYKTGEYWTSRYGSYAQNPVYYNKEWENSATMLKVSANESLSVKILPELVLKTIFSFDNTQTVDHLYYSANHFNAASVNGEVTEMSTNIRKVVSSTTLNYNKVFADMHTVNVLVGWEAEENRTDYQRATGTNLPTSALHTVATAGKKDASGYYWGNTMLSFLSRAEYNYGGKYFFSGSFRRDGSSRLGTETRWGNFWSVAGSWKINKEKFLRDVRWIDNLRLRASYGINGTLPSSNYGWRSLTSYSDQYMENPGGSVSTIADSGLSWETSYTGNLALEMGLFNYRLNANIELFNRDSKDLLQNVPISTVTGFYSTLKNIGEINNKGFEIEINGDIIRKKQFTFNAGLSASFVKSTVTELYGGQDIVWYDPTGTDDRAKFIYREGESTLAFWGLEWGGTEEATGRDIWFLNNDEEPDLMLDGRPATYDYTRATEVIIGNAHPKLYGGLNLNFEWKGIALGLNFIYKLGAKTYNAVGRDVNDGGYYFERIMSQYCYDNRWTPEHKDAIYPQRVALDFEDVNQKSSRHLNSGDFLRLKTLSLAYNLPKKVLQKINLSNLRVFFTGSNLLTFAAHKEYDPEVNEYGSRGWEIPQGKTYAFGVEFSF